MTPIHLAIIADAVANNGIAMTPNFVSGIQNYTGTSVSTNKPKEFGTLMSPEEAAQIKELMKGVVQNGTGHALNDLGIPIAGKTGSAEHGDMT